MAQEKITFYSNIAYVLKSRRIGHNNETLIRQSAGEM